METLPTDDIRDRMAQALRGAEADYLEIRLEEMESTHLQYRGRELEEVGLGTSRGGNVRALVRGGWGFVSFNGIEGLPDRVELAVRQARLVGKEDSSFAPLPPVVDREEPGPVARDPLALPLSAKKQVMDEYNQTIWSVPRIQTSSILYRDGWRRVLLSTSTGSFVERTKRDVALRVSAVARDGGQVQQAGISVGSAGDFSAVEGLHGKVKELAQRAVELLSAPPAPAGELPVVLDPVLAGVFIHEAFGHLSESDFIYENDRMREIMVLGRRFGGSHLNVVDGAAIPGLRGSYSYDDEASPATRTYLIREGVLVGRLHSRETAARMGEAPTGNARAIDYRFPPIVRMTNTIIEPGQASLDDLLEGIKEGVYARNWYGGTTSMEMFTFSSGEAFMVRNGRVAEPVRPVVLSGNVFTTLENIDAIGNDLDMNQGGGCGKGGQMPLPVSNGSPHIRIRRCVVGGR
ncbi:MAG: TldD/PmbA family protein [Dehalococcoidia bacterium]